MRNNHFGRREPMRKRISCSCGKEARLIKRRNFSHGRKSGGKSYKVYKCESCNKENMLTKTREVK